MILLAYARYPKMALLVIDPQGEFARDMRSGGPTGEFPLPVESLLKSQSKEAFVLLFASSCSIVGTCSGRSLRSRDSSGNSK